ncbi:prepilin-type N-terminal cleavage/methylation domain-containing protein [Candidatus Omnitrophota bacterium]
MRNRSGLTLLEVVFVIGILSFAIAGLLVAYINCGRLNEHDRLASQAINIARELMELEFNNRTDFDNIVSWSMADRGAEGMIATYGFNGSAAVIVNNLAADLKRVKVVVCWRSRDGSIIGEDHGGGDEGNALNGEFDSGEDTLVDNDELDSVVQLTSALSRR